MVARSQASNRLRLARHHKVSNRGGGLLGQPSGAVVTALPNTDIESDEYEGLSSTFARACHEADRDHARREQILPFRQRNRDHLPTSTRQVIDWLLKLNDADRLRNFIEGRSSEQAGKIIAYIEGKRS
jgi:hypothetical protein